MMGSSSSTKVDQVEKKTEIRPCKPRWLEPFLRNTFFYACDKHPDRKNELNKYCINCNQSACQYCVSSDSHQNHKILNIYRHVYKDVVSLASIEKHIDCSEIQPYKCNKRMVIAMNPLPHSGSTSHAGASCETCQRRLTAKNAHRYCSISCKVTAVSRKTQDSAPPFIVIEGANQEEEKPRTLRGAQRRKGKPRRAPFF